MAPLLPWLTDNSPAVLIDVTAPDPRTLAAEVDKAVTLLASEGATHIDFSTDEQRSHALWDIRKGFFASGGAARRLQALIPPGMAARLHLTLTDEYPYAFAQVIIEAVPPGA